jgi:hypothetical protein
MEPTSSNGSNEVIRQVLTAASRLAEERVAGLIATATDEAQAEVHALVKSAVKAAMLQRVAEQLPGVGAAAAAPQPAAQPTSAVAQETVDQKERNNQLGCYVYCVMPDGESMPPLSSAAIDPAYPLRSVASGELSAIVSAVPLETFRKSIDGDGNLDWLKEKVNAHNEVIREVSTRGPVIPLQFCTIVQDEDTARNVLNQYAAALSASLATVDGKKEWGVKIIAPASDFPDKSERAHAARHSSGTGYMLTKQRARSAAVKNRQQTQQFTSAWHDRLSEIAADARLLPLTEPRLNPRGRNGDSAGGTIALNAAYLVGDADEPRFRGKVEQLTAECAKHGLSLRLTGPWPPYNFVSINFAAEAVRDE